MARASVPTAPPAMIAATRAWPGLRRASTPTASAPGRLSARGACRLGALIAPDRMTSPGTRSSHHPPWRRPARAGGCEDRLRSAHGPRHAQRVRVRVRPAGTDVEPADPLGAEARRLDRRDGVARAVAAAGHARPQARAVEPLLDARLARPVRAHVLEEAQLAAGHEHAVELGQRPPRVRDRAQ